MVLARSRAEVERVIATGYYAGYYGRVKNFPSTLRREMIRHGVLEEEAVSIEDLDDEDLDAADARLEAWAQAVRDHDEGGLGPAEEE